MRAAVKASGRISVVSGQTGSGKTTFTKALIAEIPAHERLITIEDAQRNWFSTVIQTTYGSSTAKATKGRRVSHRRQLLRVVSAGCGPIAFCSQNCDPTKEAFDYLQETLTQDTRARLRASTPSSAEPRIRATHTPSQAIPGGKGFTLGGHRSICFYTLIDIVVQFSVVNHKPAPSRKSGMSRKRKRELAAQRLRAPRGACRCAIGGIAAALAVIASQWIARATSLFIGPSIYRDSLIRSL